MRRALHNFRDWLEETHSTGFELRRHFFRRFFDSDLSFVTRGIGFIIVGLGFLVANVLLFKRRTAS